MRLQKIPSARSINAAYQKVRVDRSEIESYKTNLIDLLNKSTAKSDEDNLKYLIGDFLKDTWFKGANQINPIAKNDLVIHLGRLPTDPIGVILEIKSPKNTIEMVSFEKPNAKALHELILYYLRERIDNKNTQLKTLIISNVYEWFIFDANEFDKRIFSNSSIRKLYDLKISDNKLNTFFYEELSRILNELDLTLHTSYLNFSDLTVKRLSNSDNNESKLILPFKMLSPVNLLKQAIPNDSNSLNKEFYNELLHIIGIEEKEGSHKLINRKSDKHRDAGSLIENVINKIDAVNRIADVENLSLYGKTYSEQLFNIALELVITWVNRVLFLKLLESQLIKYHNKNVIYSFLNKETIADYTELNDLFFEVLARTHNDRIGELKKKFKHVPYLNSSLFEPTELEKKVLTINNLNSKSKLSIYPTTVLGDFKGKKPKDGIETLDYIFSFLNSYDFSSEVNEVIHEEKKSLINASVLGLIFEKINGYKDGSYFTPGKITTFMCRKSLRQVIVNKFNKSEYFKSKKISAANFDDLKDKINYTDKLFRLECNTIINSTRICDPSVGSGHFLVSALNELIVIKHELGILSYSDGSIIRGFIINNEFDELNIIDEINDSVFNYVLNENGKPIDSLQKLQVALFNEKQTLIENCLFGVDINPNSVKICRLRLWIELLKNCYYSPDAKISNDFEVLQTLPNIDINIKVGNSLINRLPMSASLRDSLKHKDISIKKYYNAVRDYQGAKDKGAKKLIEAEIERIKNDFKTAISKINKDVIQLDKIERELYLKYESAQLFDGNLNDPQSLAKLKLIEKADVLKRQIQITSSNKIYQNAFEWRIEFPEILDEDGDFQGFDMVIGNPPYGNLIQEIEKSYFKKEYLSTQGPFEIYKFFIERSINLLSKDGLLCFITPNTWTNLSYFRKLRVIATNNNQLKFCSETLYNVFEEATVDTLIFGVEKSESESPSFELIDDTLSSIGFGSLSNINDDSLISLKVKPTLINKLEFNSFPIADFVDIVRGMSAYGAKNEDRPYNTFKKTDENHLPLLNGGDIGKYKIKWSGEYILYGDWLHRPRPEKIYKLPHLLVQRIRNPKLKERIVATYDDEKHISSDGLSNILCKKFVENPDLELKYLLAILNSKLINYWFSFYFFDVNIKPEQLRQIPVKRATDELKNTFRNIVDCILFINSLDNLKLNQYVPNSHILEEFNEILDALVYELYFNEEFKNEKVYIADNVKNLFTKIDFSENTSALNKVQQIYQDFRNKENETRNNLKLMDIRLGSLIMPFKTIF